MRESERATGELFPPPEPRELEHATGIMPSQLLRDAIERTREIQSLEPIADDQIQPASLDLRLGDVAYRVRASFLPGRERTVREGLRPAVAAHARSARRRRARTGLRLHRAAVGDLALRYRTSGVGQSEKLDRPAQHFRPGHHRLRHRVRPSPRRITRDRFTPRLSPRSFSIVVRKGSRLVQLRIRRGSADFQQRGAAPAARRESAVDRRADPAPRSTRRTTKAGSRYG